MTDLRPLPSNYYDLGDICKYIKHITGIKGDYFNSIVDHFMSEWCNGYAGMIHNEFQDPDYDGDIDPDLRIFLNHIFAHFFTSVDEQEDGFNYKELNVIVSW